MRRFVTGLALSALAASPAALAEESNPALTEENVIYDTTTQSPGTASQGADSMDSSGVQTGDVSGDVNIDQGEAGTVPSAGVTQATEVDPNETKLQNEGFGLKPLAGIVAYTDAVGDSTSRGLIGLEADWNVARSFVYQTPLYIGITTGVMYSHLGAPGANFFGSSDLLASSANMILIPANLKVGLAFVDSVRASVHGGGNVLYRTVANSIQTGSSSVGTSDVWKFYPNAGLDFDFALGNQAAITLRPDWTFTPGDDIFSAALGLGLALG